MRRTRTARSRFLIAVLALFLSFSETLGKSAQTEAIDANVKSTDTWAFFQAKDIRRTVVNAAAEETTLLGATPDRSCRQSRHRQTGRGLARDRRALRVRPEDGERPQRTRGARQGPGGGTRPRHGEISSLRTGVGRVSDRHRARLGGGDHRDDRARLVRAACSASSDLPFWHSACSRRTHRATAVAKRRWSPAARPSSRRRAARGLSAALRENLKRRKAQARGRAEPTTGDAVSPPEAPAAQSKAPDFRRNRGRD